MSKLTKQVIWVARMLALQDGIIPVGSLGRNSEPAYLMLSKQPNPRKLTRRYRKIRRKAIKTHKNVNHFYISKANKLLKPML